jgi:Domain of unknown function (DUF4139)
VPITLETASPTFGVAIPSLSRWNLSVYRPVIHKAVKNARASSAIFKKSKALEAREESDDDMGFGLFDDGPAVVTSKGNITATFTIPGLMSIPSDGVAHNVTIANLSLDAEMEWVSVPKREAKVHLKACLLIDLVSLFDLFIVRLSSRTCLNTPSLLDLLVST